MIYSVIPRELEPDLLERLTAHYAGNPEVTVIVDRRQGERRKRTVDASVAQQRVLRDRRRRRVTGEFAALELEEAAFAAA